MITLSEFLGTIPCAGNAHNSVQIAIREAKRLESLETPRVNAERKPLVDEEGHGHFFVVDDRGIYRDDTYGRSAAEQYAEVFTKKTARPHTVCQVMAPVNGECPTIPVATFRPTPERPHEWVIYNASGQYEGRWLAVAAGCTKYWASELTNKEVQRFATATAAQNFIDANKIADAYPWAVPKLTS